MSLHNFFSLPHSSYPHNLAYAYAAVWLLQVGYLAWIARNWSRASRRQN